MKKEKEINAIIENYIKPLSEQYISLHVSHVEEIKNPSRGFKGEHKEEMKEKLHEGHEHKE